MLWILTVVAIAAVALFIASRKPYAVSTQQFQATLTRVLQKEISGEEWIPFCTSRLAAMPTLIRFVSAC